MSTRVRTIPPTSNLRPHRTLRISKRVTSSLRSNRHSSDFTVENSLPVRLGVGVEELDNRGRLLGVAGGKDLLGLFVSALSNKGVGDGEVDRPREGFQLEPVLARGLFEPGLGPLFGVPKGLHPLLRLARPRVYLPQVVQVLERYPIERLDPLVLA